MPSLHVWLLGLILIVVVLSGESEARRHNVNGKMVHRSKVLPAKRAYRLVQGHKYHVGHKPRYPTKFKRGSYASAPAYPRRPRNPGPKYPHPKYPAGSRPGQGYNKPAPGKQYNKPAPAKQYSKPVQAPLAQQSQTQAQVQQYKVGVQPSTQVASSQTYSKQQDYKKEVTYGVPHPTKGVPEPPTSYVSFQRGESPEELYNFKHNSSSFQAPKENFGFVPYDNSARSYSLTPSKSYYAGSTVQHSPQVAPVLSPNYYDNKP